MTVKGNAKYFISGKFLLKKVLLTMLETSLEILFYCKINNFGKDIEEEKIIGVIVRYEE